MSWPAVTAEHVRRAIAECDELWHPDFRRKYKYGEALVYDLVYEGRRYDSKAILGVAYLLANGVRPSSYSGGETVVRRLRRLGFTVEDRHASEPLPAAGTGQLNWTREEIILAMDFYVTCGALGGRSVPGKLTSQIAELSALLKTLSAYPPEIQGEKYRNTNGVYQKMMNLRYVDTGGRGGLRGASQSDKAVWRDYIDNLDALHAEAAAIRLRLEEGILAPSTTVHVVDDVPIENQYTERYMQTPAIELREADRAEARLVRRYQAHMTAKGVTVSRKKYRAGQVRPIFCDLWVEERRALIEAKNSDAREALRMAVGQLYDYRRFHEPPVSLAVLLPHQPSPDGLALLQSAGIDAIWPHGEGFQDSANGTFT